MTTNASAPRSRDAEFDDAFRELAAVRLEMVAAAARGARLGRVHPRHQASARNLLHYLALRRRDLRPLQLRLAAMGLSSLGRAESHALSAVDAVLEVLRRLGSSDSPAPPLEPGVVDFTGGARLLAEHAEDLLGPAAPQRGVRIMVTMPREAADDYVLVRDLLWQGMDCMRVNCAHDDAEAWGRMIDHLRRAERQLGRSCKVVMDLAGPKLRTGPLEPGPAVARVRPRRDALGRVTAPARVWLTAAESPQAAPSPASAAAPVPAAWLAGLRVGDTLRLDDARDAKRAWRVVDVTPRGCWAEADDTAYLVPGAPLRREERRPGDASGPDDPREARVGALPPGENALRLRVGDQLVITRDARPGRDAVLDSAGRVLTPGSIGCTLPEVFKNVRSGESIWFDDGKIGGVIEKVEDERVLARVTHARAGGEKLRADKGINLPDSALELPALTGKDIEDLAFVAERADVVNLSFSNDADDVETLLDRLTDLGPKRPGVVLKVETRRGFEQLPAMLLAAMRWPLCGVMIARGDLAVECGFERLAEVQEEILWICEAAHTPVIWATQVLETLAKDGLPSRAEITDAAMGHRAECVMLNKGPHVLSAVRVLDDILRRMQAHQTKKRSMLRALRLARAWPEDAGE